MMMDRVWTEGLGRGLKRLSVLGQWVNKRAINGLGFAHKLTVYTSSHGVEFSG